MDTRCKRWLRPLLARVWAAFQTSVTLTFHLPSPSASTWRLSTRKCVYTSVTFHQWAAWNGKFLISYLVQSAAWSAAAGNRIFQPTKFFSVGQLTVKVAVNRFMRDTPETPCTHTHTHPIKVLAQSPAHLDSWNRHNIRSVGKETNFAAYFWEGA